MTRSHVGYIFKPIGNEGFRVCMGKISRPAHQICDCEARMDETSNSRRRKGFERADDLWDCAGIQNSIIGTRRAETQRQRVEAGTAVTFNRPAVR